MPTVSILVPTFNREKFLEECIESALGQKDNDFEVVIVDNASTDSTWEICGRFAVRDPRVRIFRNEHNVGPVRNWKRCIEEARGRYGKFLFSDDLMLPDFLAESVPRLRDSTIAFVSTAALIGEDLERSSVSYATRRGPEIISTATYFRRLATGFPGVPVSPSAAIFRLGDLRRNLLMDVPTAVTHDFAGNGAGPDVLLFALTAKDYPSVAMLDKPLVFFRKHPGSFTIANERNAVKVGYELALGWFFRMHSSLSNWASWTARIWLRGMLNARRFSSPISTIKRCSGKGNVVEVGSLVIAALGLVLQRIRKRAFAGRTITDLRNEQTAE